MQSLKNMRYIICILDSLIPYLSPLVYPTPPIGMLRHCVSWRGSESGSDMPEWHRTQDAEGRVFATFLNQATVDCIANNMHERIKQTKKWDLESPWSNTVFLINFSYINIARREIRKEKGFISISIGMGAADMGGKEKSGTICVWWCVR